MALSNTPSPLDSPANQENLVRLAQRGILDAPALERALQISGDSPDRDRWARFLDLLLLVFGTGSLVSGIFFFFAFNWTRLHRFTKLGMLEIAILGTVGLAFWRGLDRMSGKIALGAAGLLVGVLLAVYGQIYQTGADSYRLFLYWALLIAGWVWISKFVPLWFIWIVLLNITLGTYWFQVVGDVDNRLNLLVFILNGVPILGWELARRAGMDWVNSRWPPRLVALPVFLALVLPTISAFSGFVNPFEPPDSLQNVMVLLYLGLTALVIYVYSQVRLDRFMLTVCAFGLMMTVNTLVSRFFDIGVGTLLCLSALFIIEAAVVVILLRRVSSAWEARGG